MWNGAAVANDRRQEEISSYEHIAPDAESINRGVRDSPFLNRATAKGGGVRWSICSATPDS
jgi:hypothetical protein